MATDGSADRPREEAQTIVVRSPVQQAVGGSSGDLTDELLMPDWRTDAMIAADVVTDCTGLEADISEHRVLADLLEHSGARRNPVGRLGVERTFELRGTPGVMYGSGAGTPGGYLPGVDTFLGPQIAAQEITDDLARRRFWRKIGPGRSAQQWLRGAIPDIAGEVGGAAFLIQFIMVWLGVWLIADGPMRVPFIRWRFHGGRLV